MENAFVLHGTLIDVKILNSPFIIFAHGLAEPRISDQQLAPVFKKVDIVKWNEIPGFLVLQKVSLTAMIVANKRKAAGHRL